MAIIYPSIPTDNFATKQSNQFSGSQTITGSLIVSGAITASVNGIRFPDSTIQTTAFTGGGSSGADVSASYVVIGTTASLPNERQLSASNGLTITDNGANSTVVLSALNASTTQNGIVTTGSQTFAGTKAFNNTIVAPSIRVSTGGDEPEMSVNAAGEMVLRGGSGGIGVILWANTGDNELTSSFAIIGSDTVWRNDTGDQWAIYNLSTKQVGIGTINPAASALLELSSSDKGMLFPRVSGSARAAMTTTTGLIVYQTDTSGSDGEGLYIYKSTGWVQII